MKISLIKYLAIGVLALLVSSSGMKACDRSDLTFLGITGSNMPFGPYVISVRLCVGMGVTLSTLGGDQRTNTFMFAFWSANTNLAISSFTPASVTGPPITVGGGCTPGVGCTNTGGLFAGPFQGSTDCVRYAQGGFPCNGTKSYGCISSTCLCGPAQALCTTHTFTTNIIPDSMRATGIEGAGNNVGGCYPNADMKVDFNLVFPVLWGDVLGERSSVGVDVKWTTIRESNTDYFIVQRSSDGVNFNEIGQVIAAGYSNNENAYAFMDNSPVVGQNLYRVVNVDKTGGSFDSQIVEVNYFRPESLSWGTVGPNPASEYLDMSFYSPKASKMSYQVFDLGGKLVLESQIDAVNGGNTARLDVSQLNAGSYFLALQSSTEKLTRKFVKI